MYNKIKSLLILPFLAITLSSCTKTAKDLIVTGDYYLNENTPIILKYPNFKSSNPDLYQLELTYFHLNITEIDYDEYLSIVSVNETSKENKTTVFQPQDEFVYYKANFNMQFKLYKFENEQAYNNNEKVEVKTSPDKTKDIYGTYIGRFNRIVNTYYFLLDEKDPCYEDSSQSGEDKTTLLLLNLTINNPEYVIARLSSKKGELYTNDRWYRSFPLEYSEV